MKRSLINLMPLLVLLITACASPGIPPTQLRQPAVADAFILKTPLQYTYRDVDRGILPGTYRADRADDSGTFYICEGRCVWDKRHGEKFAYVYPGGVYLPNDPTLGPRLYRVFTTSELTTENLNEYINQRTSTSIIQGGSVGANVVGGVIAGLVVQAGIDASVGRHLVFEQSPEQRFLSELGAATSTRSIGQGAPAAK